MFVSSNAAELPALRGALSALGCGDSEIKTYEVLLESGHRPASFIARKAGMNRVYAYDVLSTLERKGLIYSYERNSVTHFASLPPREIVQHLHEQERRLVSMRAELNTFVERIALEAEQGSIPSVAVLRGADACGKAVKRIHVGDHEVVRVIGNPVLLSKRDDARWTKALVKQVQDSDGTLQVLITSATPIPEQSDNPRVNVRHVKEEPIPCQLILTEQTLAILLENDKTAIILQKGIFSEVVSWMHQTLWRSSEQGYGCEE